MLSLYVMTLIVFLVLSGLLVQTNNTYSFVVQQQGHRIKEYQDVSSSLLLSSSSSSSRLISTNNEPMTKHNTTAHNLHSRSTQTLPFNKPTSYQSNNNNNSNNNSSHTDMATLPNVASSLNNASGSTIDQPSKIGHSYSNATQTTHVDRGAISSVVADNISDPTLLKRHHVERQSLNHTVDDPLRAIFLISMGQQATDSMIVERCILSIRRRGKWNGKIVLLTDAPPDRYKSLIATTNSTTTTTTTTVTTSKNLENNNIFIMSPQSHHFKWELKKDMIYKRYKTFILDYMDLDPRLQSIELIYYLDVDIVVGAPLKPFFAFIESKYNILTADQAQMLTEDDGARNSNIGNTSNTSLSEPDQPQAASSSLSNTVYFFKGNFNHWPIQGGQFILERQNSQRCLDLWRQAIDSNPTESMDQTALRHVYESKEAQTQCNFVLMEQKPHVSFPRGPTALRRMMEYSNYTTLVHVKNSHTTRIIPDSVQRQFYAKILDLNGGSNYDGTLAAFGNPKDLVRRIFIRPNQTWSQTEGTIQASP